MDGAEIMKNAMDEFKICRIPSHPADFFIRFYFLFPTR